MNNLRLIIGLWLALGVTAFGAELVDSSSWMRSLDDKTLISRVSLPGTHQSASRKEPFRGTAQCQDLSIEEQLVAGVRFFDIRCRHVKDRFEIFHGAIDQGLNFDEILVTFRDFLQKNESEFLVFSVNGTGREVECTRSFEETFRWYAKRYEKTVWTGDKIMPVGRARGRAILFRRFSAQKKLGLDASRWGGSRRFQSGWLDVQDAFVVKDVAAKWALAERALLDAKAEVGKDKTYVNFLSGYRPGRLGIPDIRVVAKGMNSRAEKFFDDEQKGFYGWVLFDFVTADLSRRVFMTNLR